MFAVDLVENDHITLILNTQKHVRLKPKNLFTQNDSLYMRLGNENIKFAERGLMKISYLLEFSDDRYFIKVNNRRYRIVEK